MQQIRLWEVTSDQQLVELQGDPIPLEKQLEDWLESDISVLDSNLLVIGRQVETDFGGTIDLLCLDGEGHTVIVELKKGRTPRDVTAQALDYASWAKDLSFERLAQIADEYFNNPGSLAAKFQEHFKTNFPEKLNQDHRSLVVAESMDAGTERIVRYLSDYNVPINAVNVKHFKDETGRKMLARVYTIDPEIAEERARSASSRKGVTLSYLQAEAERNGIGEMFQRMRKGTRGVLRARPYVNRMWYGKQLPDGWQRLLMIVWTGSTEQSQSMDFVVHATRFSEHLGVSEEQLPGWLPDNTREANVRGWSGSSPEERESAQGLEGTFRSVKDVEKFLAGLRTMRQE